MVNNRIPFQTIQLGIRCRERAVRARYQRNYLRVRAIAWRSYQRLIRYNSRNENVSPLALPNLAIALFIAGTTTLTTRSYDQQIRVNRQREKTPDPVSPTCELVADNTTGCVIESLLPRTTVFPNQPNHGVWKSSEHRGKSKRPGPVGIKHHCMRLFGVCIGEANVGEKQKHKQNQQVQQRTRGIEANLNFVRIAKEQLIEEELVSMKVGNPIYHPANNLVEKTCDGAGNNRA